MSSATKRSVPSTGDSGASFQQSGVVQTLSGLDKRSQEGRVPRRTHSKGCGGEGQACPQDSHLGYLALNHVHTLPISLFEYGMKGGGP